MNDRKLISRREFVVGSSAALGGLLLSGCGKKVLLPPTYGNILRVADNLTYAAHRTLLPGQALAREYSHKDISSFPATGTVDPGEPGKPASSELYRRLQGGGFADWRITVEGSVARPATFSLADLKRFPSRTQITRHTCEEGWTAVGEWTGVPLSRVLDAAGLLPSACCVCFYSYDDWADSIDLLDALHPQTLLAYGMNGRDLRVPHGAPVRLRVETQLGYKSMKYLQRIVVKDVLDDGGDKGNPKNGWAWYTGI
jgi:DMSO/TMAO reductase YedYZ molybdopterin-dependent catalytic subunit